MALSLVTLKWNVTDLIQAGIPANLVITPTAPLIDQTDGSEVAVYPRVVNFRNGTGQLAGIVANDSADVLPQGTGYVIVITAWTGEVIYSQTVKILIANGASQRLVDLAPVESVVAMAAYLLLTGGTLLGALAPAVVTLTDAPVIALNAAAGNQATVTLTASRTLGAPASPSNGQLLLVELIQDEAGGHSITLGSGYGFLPGLPQNEITLTQTPGAVNYLGLRYRAATSLWYPLAFI